MKYIFFAYEGEGLPIAYQLQKEGHDVVVGMVQDGKDTLSRIEKGDGSENPIRKKRRLRLYDQLLKKIPAKELIEQMKTIPDPQNYFVYNEMNLLFEYSQKAAALGFHGNFPTEEDYLFEIDRQKAKDFVAKHYTSFSEIETKSFTKIADAIEFLHSDDNLWVVKGFDAESSVFVPDSKNPDAFRKQTINELRQYQELYERSGFILERFIKNLIELTPERIYYNGKLLGATLNFENKPIGSGNISLQTGCAADLVLPIPLDSKLNQIAFPPIVDELAKKHKGLFFWDASLLIDADTNNIYFGEFCPNRPGYNAFYTELAPSPTINEFFEKVVAGESPYIPGTVGASTRIFNLTRTADDTSVLSDTPIELIGKDDKGIFMMDVYGKDNQILISGYDMNFAVVTGNGKTIMEAVTMLYARIETVSYGEKYYRPQFDYLSRSYSSSILNRLEYVMKNNLVAIPPEMLMSL